MKRVVLFDRSKSTVRPAVLKEKKDEVDIPIKNEPQTDTSSVIIAELAKSPKITKWINDHPLFKWGTMCDSLGIDKGNFHRILNSKEPKIKIELISPIENILKDYGYAK